MGYKRGKTYLLEWETTSDFHGLQVRVRGTRVGEYLAIIDSLDTQDAETLRDVFEQFSKFLISWNLEDEDGTPIPADIQGVLEADMDIMTAILEAWQLTLASVSKGKEPRSNDGSRSAEASIPMETLSPSLAS